MYPYVDPSYTYGPWRSYSDSERVPNGFYQGQTKVNHQGSLLNNYGCKRDDRFRDRRSPDLGVGYSDNYQFLDGNRADDYVYVECGAADGSATGCGYATETSSTSGSKAPSPLTDSSMSPVELHVSNLDQNIPVHEMRKILLAAFAELGVVLGITMYEQSDGFLSASVTLGSVQEAQFAISQLHRKRIGLKRIVISYATRSQKPMKAKRLKILALLKEIPGKKLPLFKFRELYEKRYQEAIGVSEINSLKDIVTVSDSRAGRTVSLNTDCRYLESLMKDAALNDPTKKRFCARHFQPSDGTVGWAEIDLAYLLPRVDVSLNQLGEDVLRLVESHSGSVPLASFVDCYAAEMGPVAVDENGVSLEHLISCLPEFTIIREENGLKFVRKSDDSNESRDDFVNICPPLVGNVVLFSREVVDLLKTHPRCELLMSKFISSYYYHFGRQCRVADYGFTRLSELLESLPQLVQILGDGAKATLTLTHRCQVKRFSSDLIRVLKAQPAKSVTLDDFGSAFERIVGRPWNVHDYGVCRIDDLLHELLEASVVLREETGLGPCVSIPKREQTAEEVERTRGFSVECVELLRHAPRCMMKFNRFIPSYHHHFGRQCRVADFGFTKLVEIFEVIPDVVQVLEDENGERVIQLTRDERLRILGEQIFTLVKNSPERSIKADVLLSVFTRFYGYALKPDHYDCCDVFELIQKLESYVKIERSEGGGAEVVTLVDRSASDELWERCRVILWRESSCSLPADRLARKLSDEGLACHGEIENELSDYIEKVEVDGKWHYRLAPLQVFLRDALVLLSECGGRMALANFETAFFNRFGVSCNPGLFGFSNLLSLFTSLDSFFGVKGKKTRSYLVLNKAALSHLPDSLPPNNSTGVLQEGRKWNNFSYTSVSPGHETAKSQQGSKPTQKRGPQESSPVSCFQPTREWNKDFSGSPVIMGLNHSHQQPFQQQPVIYSGSPHTGSAPVVWGQIWSPPPYSVISPVSPAPYVLPTIPVNWTRVPVVQPASTPPQFAEAPEAPTLGSPVSVFSLEQTDANEVSPPSPNALPSPDFLKTPKSASD